MPKDGIMKGIKGMELSSWPVTGGVLWLLNRSFLRLCEVLNMKMMVSGWLMLQTFDFNSWKSPIACLKMVEWKESKELNSAHDQAPSPDLAPHQQMGVLTIMEKRFLLAVERGDVASTRRWVEIFFMKSWALNTLSEEIKGLYHQSW